MIRLGLKNLKKAQSKHSALFALQSSVFSIFLALLYKFSSPENKKTQ